MGAMLTWLLFDHSDRCVSALRAVIRVLNGVGFPKGLVERVFMHLYVATPSFGVLAVQTLTGLSAYFPGTTRM